MHGLPFVIYIWKKYKAYPLGFILEKIQGLSVVIGVGKNRRLTPCDLFVKNTRLTPCDLFVKKIQGLPLVIYFWGKCKVYPL